MGFAMWNTNNNRKIRTFRASIKFAVAGIVAAVILFVVLWIYNPLISDDVLIVPAILLNIISLATLLFRPRKLMIFWVGFIFALFLGLACVVMFIMFNAIMFNVTIRLNYSLLFYSTLASILLLLPLPQYFAKTSTKTPLPSATDQAHIEQLGSLYSWIFFAQIMFLTILIYGSRASIHAKGLGLFADTILYLITIYEFDQRARFNASTFAIVLKTLAKHFKTKDYFIELIERPLHKIKCSIKPLIEELGIDLFLGALISLLLATIIITFSDLSKLNQLIIAISISMATMLFVLSIGVKLYRKCRINLMIGLLSLPFWFGKTERQSLRLPSIAFNAFVYIITGMVLAVIAVLLSKVLSIWLLILLLALILASLIFTILFILSLTTVVALAMIHGYLSQVLTMPMNQPDETVTNLILLSIITFTMFTAFSSITCLRHNVECDEE